MHLNDRARRADYGRRFVGLVPVDQCAIFFDEAGACWLSSILL